MFRMMILVGAVATLAACGQMTGAKTAPAPTDSTATTTAAAPADASGAKPGEAAGGADTDGAKPAEPTQAPANAAPDKPS